MKTLSCLFCLAMLASGTLTERLRAELAILQPALVSVTVSQSGTAEGSSEPAVFTVKRTGSTDESVMVFYRAGGSAVNGLDYKKLPGSILIPPGAASADIAVAAIDDGIAEEEEKVVLTLTPPGWPLASTASTIFGYQIGEPASASVNIADNDADVKLPTVSIAATVAEAQEEGPKNGEFTISRFGSTAAALAVQYEIVTHSIIGPSVDILANPQEFPILLIPAAQNGKDYKMLSGSLLIPEGKKSATILVGPVNDQLPEGREHLTLRLKSSDTYNINAPETETVFIQDKETVRQLPPKVAIDEPRSGETFAEHSDIKVKISTADADGYVPKMDLFDGEKLIASEQREFLVKPPPGQLETFELLWKDALAGKHRLTARATDDTGVAGKSTVVEVEVVGPFITPTVTIKATKPEVVETRSDDTGRFTVSRTGSSRTKLNVHYLIAGTAQNGIDYSELSGMVEIPAGESSVRILIKPVPDKALEGNETVILTLEQRVFIVAPAPEENYIVGDPKSATVVIVENPRSGSPPKVDITQPKSGDTFVEHTTIKVEIQTADADGYVPRMELYDGDKLIESETRNFLVRPPDGRLEQFAFEWKDVTAGEHKLIAKATDDSGLSSSSSPIKVIVLREDDIPVVTITAQDEEASEADPKNTATFRVHRTGSPRTALHVYYEIGGNAENGEDYKKLNGMITIPANQEDARIVLDPIQDRKLEGKESVTLALVERVFKTRPGPEDDYRVGVPRAATIVINDSPHDNQPPRITIVSPKNGAEFLAHANIEIEAKATDPEGEIREVDLFANEDLLVSFKTPPFTFYWRDVPVGKYALRAKVVDDGGMAGNAEPVAIVVKEPVGSSFAKRELPEFYTPGETFKVLIETTPGEGIQVYAIQDRPPRGWTVGTVNEGGAFDPANHEVKFGPFFDNKPRTLIYEVTPPANESGSKEFSGTASADGVNSEIGGNQKIGPKSTRHPADLDPADNRITIQELTSYALAWKAGKVWSIAPNPIPQSYVTRAGEIWHRGESYTYDPSQGPAPLWWVPKQSPGLLSVNRKVETSGDDNEQSGRATRSIERVRDTDHGLLYLVTVKISPKPGVSAYTVEEAPPSGWVVSEVSEEGIFDSTGGKIRWGIFLDDQPRSLTYHVIPAGDHKHNTGFEGVASFDGIDVPVQSDAGPDQGRGHAFGRLKNLRRHLTGECEISFSVETGYRYRIQASTDLSVWFDVGGVVSEAGEVQVFDTEASNSSIRYYRAILSD